ncbi:hypothetical protein SAMN05421641_12056 [Paracoccus thiocyanatus]|uniref:Uncharacterized protein n=1 Tax=Paracoccus thiocyanatus TaxID=34006 RepID=A0A1N6XD77_9RHOB|nr:hypothetical protein [Paracoccus thiocyanatus]SIR00304.1 hypothetical protein SAMN05421641_12056 [Paracoccus thiocyanatus]
MSQATFALHDRTAGKIAARLSGAAGVFRPRGCGQFKEVIRCLDRSAF